MKNELCLLGQHVKQGVRLTGSKAQLWFQLPTWWWYYSILLRCRRSSSAKTQELCVVVDIFQCLLCMLMTRIQQQRKLNEGGLWHSADEMPQH